MASSSASQVSSGALNALIPGMRVHRHCASAAAGVLGNQVCTIQHVINLCWVWSRNPPHVPAAWPDVKSCSALRVGLPLPWMAES